MLKTVQIYEAKVSATVQRTGKTYHRSLNYAKHIIWSLAKESIKKYTHEYYLRKDNKWEIVNESEFIESLNEDNINKIHQKLNQELRQRVEKIMSKP